MPLAGHGRVRDQGCGHGCGPRGACRRRGGRPRPGPGNGGRKEPGGGRKSRRGVPGAAAGCAGRGCRTSLFRMRWLKKLILAGISTQRSTTSKRSVTAVLGENIEKCGKV